MNRDPELDTIGRILASEEALVPSSGFVSAVMGRVHEENSALAPIPFPWKRALPGMSLAAAVFGWGVFEMLRHASELRLSPSMHITGTGLTGLESADWAVMALAVSLLTWHAARRLIGGSGLL
jgi:hypothetical protein